MRAILRGLALTCSCLTGAAGLAAPEGVQARSRRAAQGSGAVAGRRALVAGALASALVAAPNPAQAKIEDTNPANNYYFPMARRSLRSAPLGSPRLSPLPFLPGVLDSAGSADGSLDGRRPRRRPSTDISRASSGRGSRSISWLPARSRSATGRASPRLRAASTTSRRRCRCTRRRWRARARPSGRRRRLRRSR